MNTQQQARALMTRHQQMLKNRQQAMLERAGNEIGLEAIKSLNDSPKIN